MTPAQQREADAASQRFHQALVAIGALAVAEALRNWESCPPEATPEQAARWAVKAINLTMVRRAGARALALAFYRYDRALRTGSTVADPRRRGETQTTIPALRREFEALVQQRPLARTPAPTQEAGSGVSGPSPAIPVEEAPEPAAADRAAERAAREEARVALTALGALRQQREVRDLREPTPEKVQAIHEQAGARQAAAASRIAQNGARAKLWSVGEADTRSIGWIRVSRTGTPCGWCAMLISRGAVYRTQKAATLKGGASSYEDGDKYHDNCQCYALQIFSEEQLTSSLFDLNREYAEAWPRVTRGLSGKAAVSAWRRYIKSTRDSQVESPDTAQEATA